MDDTQWLSQREQEAWVRFAAVLELLPSALDTQLSKDSDLTHFDYFCLSTLSETPTRILLTSELAARTNATLPRLSRVLTKLEKREYITRTPCKRDRRATEVALTETGWNKVVASAPGHVTEVRRLVVDALEPNEIDQLANISAKLLSRLDPEQRVIASSPLYRRQQPDTGKD
ncbi:MAG: MarR family winged helix-turn-helix transcriptional regulator [Corynebacterium casei]|uniref:MarR family winged helix-turn-helix transcriptional regulator n=1 Tax=Corynebacterium casei TaxID=160386 RepID=UPI002647FB64|nr:MarR family transcriptional regulator [Corynebacterium casei]MDN6263959.1 MarR family transcriptional regulator [Corynebacterium casei]